MKHLRDSFTFICYYLLFVIKFPLIPITNLSAFSAFFENFLQGYENGEKTGLLQQNKLSTGKKREK